MSVSTLLNSYQYDALAVTLRLVEKSLREAQSNLQDCINSTPGILYYHTLHLTSAQRSTVLQKIAEALDEIAAIASLFALQPVEEDLSSRLAANMSLHWANLMDVHSARLARYGPVAPDLSDLLDPHLKGLAQLMLVLAESVREKPAK